MQQKIEREDCNPTRNNGNAKYKRVLLHSTAVLTKKKMHGRK